MEASTLVEPEAANAKALMTIKIVTVATEAQLAITAKCGL